MADLSSKKCHVFSDDPDAPGCCMSCGDPREAHPSREHFYAEMEAARNQAEHSYFAARPQADHPSNKALFRAGYERGFEKLWYERVGVETAVPIASEQQTRDRLLGELIRWVDSRLEAEVAHRPDVNIHKRTLSDTWHQVRRKLEEMISGALPASPVEAREDPIEKAARDHFHRMHNIPLTDVWAAQPEVTKESYRDWARKQVKATPNIETKHISPEVCTHCGERTDNYPVGSSHFCDGMHSTPSAECRELGSAVKSGERSGGTLPPLATPLPPEVLADALQDRVHEDTGPVRAGQSVKHKC